MSAFKFLFLGTSAFDYSEKMETEFKDKFDYDVRRSASGLLNERYLIDCGYHCEDSIRIAGVDKSKITDIFITHFHGDHCCTEILRRITANRETPIKVWVRHDAKTPDLPNVNWVRMNCMQEYVLPDGTSVKGFYANHDESVWPQHLLFEKEGKKFLYACDGAWFLGDTLYALQDSHLDFIVLDGTCGDNVNEWRVGHHNSIPMLRILVPALRSIRAINEDTLVYISHIAPSLHKPHFETVELMKEINVKVAYDGLVEKV